MAPSTFEIDFQAPPLYLPFNLVYPDAADHVDYGNMLPNNILQPHVGISILYINDVYNFNFFLSQSQ